MVLPVFSYASVGLEQTKQQELKIGDKPLLSLFKILGWDIICPRLVAELNEILVRNPQQHAKEKKRDKCRRKIPLGCIKGRQEPLQITQADLYAYLAVLIEMGLHPCSSDKDYWRKEAGMRLYMLPNLPLHQAPAIHGSKKFGNERNGRRYQQPFAICQMLLSIG